MYTYFNAHPQGKSVDDCVKRAITVATGMDYMEVQRELNRHKKITGAKSFNERKNCDHYVETVLHGVRMSFPAKAGRPRMNGQRFMEAYPKGRYILNMAGHWSCCVDGVIYDTWDCSEKCVYTAYKVEKVEPVDPMVKTFTLQMQPYNKTQITIYENSSEYKTVLLNDKEALGYQKCLKDMGYTRKHKGVNC